MKNQLKLLRNVRFIIFSILLVNCSSYVQRTYQSQEEYFSIVNKELENKSVLVHLLNNVNEVGNFIKINSNSVFIINTDTLEINTNNVHSISYKMASPDWFVGALAGFSAGTTAFLISGATIDFGGGGKYPYMVYAIPACTFIGSILGGVESDNYKTYVIHE